ncbi:CaeNaCin (Caenorhabditis bacteriocin) [Caenorhabditis elegans]|uniref:CaeNaCin (Caenorhabditis bacteriocin) n=1 Tax=Caenorhabditis elegans TaxID=6239 RepID=Q9N3V6_CAEEL|nr:CaeNaCin (Caenorhabditis bacteriocin) [Caenorhabditis elegans]CCD73783.1 CaeNaCin (Caenorhabditis bacteriocin) [Caenorhabditis elegans]|eukprot:NP_497455.1 CaeNaCin (Caenorhabditis bacteriocin) [Caenorhabditis elegans]
MRSTSLLILLFCILATVFSAPKAPERGQLAQAEQVQGPYDVELDGADDAPHDRSKRWGGWGWGRPMWGGGWGRRGWGGGWGRRGWGGYGGYGGYGWGR